MAKAAGSAVERRREKLHQLTELGAVIVLSLGALGSSYAGFQSNLWDGKQSEDLSLAASAQRAANKEATLALQRESVNAMHFTQWLNAYASGNSELAAFYRDRFRPRFHEAFDRWIATRPRFNPNSPPTPFDVPGYRDGSTSLSDRLEREATAYFDAGKRDNHVSDAYSQSVVVFALALFMGGIIQAFNSHRTRCILLAFAASACVIALVLLARLPAIRLI